MKNRLITVGILTLALVAVIAAACNMKTAAQKADNYCMRLTSNSESVIA